MAEASPIFTGKVRSLPLEQSFIRDFTQVDSNLACEHKARVQLTESDNHDSLQSFGIFYSREKMF